MIVRWQPLFTVAVCGIVASALVVLAQGQTGGQRPARDRAGDRTAPTQPQGTARLSGRVLAADTGRPIRRARVMLSSTDIPGRAAQTDDQGAFEFTGLAAGRYSLTASKSGFVNLSYGQRRPRQPGTPIQLTDGQQLSTVNFSLPRGSVISGHVLDDAGEPLVGATVQVLRYEYAQGNRQLVPAGAGTTDDQGAFRVWGLNPGNYYLSATMRNFEILGGGGPLGSAGPVVTAFAGGRGGNAQFVGRGGMFLDAVMSGGDPTAAPEAYAPTYYPGVAAAAEAQVISVGLSTELSNINFGALLVRTARVTGRVASSDGSTVGGGNVTLSVDGMLGLGPGTNFGARIQADGNFMIPNVPPGRYVLRARAGGQDAPQFALQPLTVGDGNAPITVLLTPGATLSGTVTFQGAGSTTVPDASQVRVVAPTTDFSLPGPLNVARVDRDGRFTLTGVSAGSHWIRPQGGLRGWTLKSVVIDGRDMIDTPIDVRSGEALGSISLVFTDRSSEINGTLTDERQSPLTDYTVLAFPTDQSLWRPQARQILTARPDQNGKFQIRGLPPGEYYVTPIDPVEQGEWFDPVFLEPRRDGAARLSLGEGDTKTQNFKLATP